MLQASKSDPEQTRITGSLQPFDAEVTTADVCVVGCGPAGLALAAELGKNGLTVALIGELAFTPFNGDKVSKAHN